MSAVISRVFMNGNSQAVRIPQEFRLEASRVEIRRNEHGDLVIHPIPADRGSALLRALASFDDEVGHAFAEALEEERRHQTGAQEREGL